MEKRNISQNIDLVEHMSNTEVFQTIFQLYEKSPGSKCSQACINLLDMLLTDNYSIQVLGSPTNKSIEAIISRGSMNPLRQISYPALQLGSQFYQSRINQLESQIASTNSANQSHLRKMDSDIASVNSTFQPRLSEIESQMASMNSELQSRLTKLESQTASIQSTHDIHLRKIDSQIASLNSSLQSLSNQYSQLFSTQSKLSSLHSSFEDTKQKYNAQEQSLRNLDSRLSYQISDLSRRLTSLSTSIDTLRQTRHSVTIPCPACLGKGTRLDFGIGNSDNTPGTGRHHTHSDAIHTNYQSCPTCTGTGQYTIQF